MNQVTLFTMRLRVERLSEHSAKLVIQESLRGLGHRVLEFRFELGPRSRRPFAAIAGNAQLRLAIYKANRNTQGFRAWVAEAVAGLLDFLGYKRPEATVREIADVALDHKVKSSEALQSEGGSHD